MCNKGYYIMGKEFFPEQSDLGSMKNSHGHLTLEFQYGPLRASTG
jgi:hypothetical protein